MAIWVLPDASIVQGETSECSRPTDGTVTDGTTTASAA